MTNEEDHIKTLVDCLDVFYRMDLNYISDEKNPRKLVIIHASPVLANRLAGFIEALIAVGRVNDGSIKVVNNSVEFELGERKREHDAKGLEIIRVKLRPKCAKTK